MRLDLSLPRFSFRFSSAVMIRLYLLVVRNANVISQGLAWTALERCEDGE